MKSDRVPVKAHLAGLPYSALAHARRHDASLLTRVARRVGATVAKFNPLRQRGEQEGQHGTDSEEVERGIRLNGEKAQNFSAGPSTTTHVRPLQPGDVLRDVPFPTQSSEATFFSTHPSLCADVFGLVPGEVFEIMRESASALLGHVVVVVGARGGKLWVLVHGEASARVLHVPVLHGLANGTPSSTAATASSAPAVVSASSREVRAAILAYHDAHLLFHPLRSLTATEDAERSKLRGVVFDQKTYEERSMELQRAQQEELSARVEQVRTDYAALRTRAAGEVQRVYTAEQRAFLQRAPDLYVAVIPDATPANAGQRIGSAASATAPASPSVYAAVVRGDAEAAAVVLLPPRIVVATGTVGWAGEGDVTLQVPQAGRGVGEGSLSASVVLQ